MSTILDGARDRMRYEHNARAWLAWHTAALTAYAPRSSRQFTRLDDLLSPEDRRPKKRMTADELIAATKAWMEQGRNA